MTVNEFVCRRLFMTYVGIYREKYLENICVFNYRGLILGQCINGDLFDCHSIAITGVDDV